MKQVEPAEETSTNSMNGFKKNLEKITNMKTSVFMDYIRHYLPVFTRCHHERCPWWPDRAESFRKKNLFKSPTFPQVAIKFILKDIK